MEIIHASRLVTCVGDEVIENGAVLVKDGKIAAVGTLDYAKREAGTSCAVTNLGDMTIVPGLFDCHVHLCFDGGPDPVSAMMAQSDEQQLILMLKSARELLSAGVTTARDLGARGHLATVVKEAIDTGMAPGPELLVANQPITPTGGHFWFMGGEVDTVDEIKRAVRERHKSGANLVKVMCTGGFMTAGSPAWKPQFSLAELRVLVDEARRLDMGVAAHAHGTAGIRIAAEAGVDTIEHCSWTADGSSTFGTGPSTTGYEQEVVELLVSKGIPVSAMYVRFKYFAEDRRRTAIERFRRMRQAGIRFIAGTDSGIDEMPHHEFGHRLALMADYGFSPPEILRAATIGSALALHVSDRKGSIAPGKDADLSAFDGDPLNNVSTYKDCRFAMSRGVVAPRPPL